MSKDEIHRIETPRGMVVSYKSVNKSGGVSFTSKLEWNDDFGREMSNGFNKTQKYIDSEVLRRCSPKLPFLGGMLEKSGILGTVVGSGEVIYNAPYARFLYYGKVMVGEKSGSAWARQDEKKVVTNADLMFKGSPTRGAFWFERMKSESKLDILKGAQREAGIK